MSERAWFLSRCREGSPVAVKTVGNWYWIVDEIEEARIQAEARSCGQGQAHAGDTGKLDARGLNKLQRTGTLLRCGSRPGSFLGRGWCWCGSGQQRVYDTLAKNGMQGGASDLFGVKGGNFCGRNSRFCRRAPAVLQRVAAADRHLGRRDPGHRGEDAGGGTPSEPGVGFNLLDTEEG